MPYAYFRDEIPHVIAAAELVLCRSGAGTIWECKYLNKPMVLIPFRGSGTRGDQVENARIFQDAGAAICFIPNPQNLLEDKTAKESTSAEKLSAIITSLSEDPERLKAMREAKIDKSIDGERTDAAALIAKEIAQRIEEEK
jgi:UDP-N-acetylglucosamine--N-acetylmuramyl-(pentapeptide) pyrophosphoryl-undecaprenol N-acetylglucosamine transferase